MGGGQKPPQRTDRSDLNDMLNQDQATQFLGPQPTPTPTPQGGFTQLGTMLDAIHRMGIS